MKNIETKFFKVVEFEGTENENYSLYICEKTTPIPTMEEIIQRRHYNPCCKDDKVKEISMEEFLILNNQLLAQIIDSANDVKEWAPNFGDLNTWEYWESEEEIEE